jgi:hypothetical protein
MHQAEELFGFGERHGYDKFVCRLRRGLGHLGPGGDCAQSICLLERKSCRSRRPSVSERCKVATRPMGFGYTPREAVDAFLEDSCHCETGRGFNNRRAVRQRTKAQDCCKGGKAPPILTGAPFQHSDLAQRVWRHFSGSRGLRSHQRAFWYTLKIPEPRPPTRPATGPWAILNFSIICLRLLIHFLDSRPAPHHLRPGQGFAGGDDFCARA